MNAAARSPGKGTKLTGRDPSVSDPWHVTPSRNPSPRPTTATQVILCATTTKRGEYVAPMTCHQHKWSTRPDCYYCSNQRQTAALEDMAAIARFNHDREMEAARRKNQALKSATNRAKREATGGLLVKEWLILAAVVGVVVIALLSELSKLPGFNLVLLGLIGFGVWRVVLRIKSAKASTDNTDSSGKG